MISGGTTTGFDLSFIFPGTLPVPLDLDFFLTCFWPGGPCAPLLLGQTGVLNAQGDAFGAISVPNVPGAIGITWYASFFTYTTNFFVWHSVSPPSPPILIQ